MEFQSHLGKIRGLGSTNDGLTHWKMQRISGVALVPLFVWFMVSLFALDSLELHSFKAWLTSNANPVLLILLVTFMFHHGFLGLQVIFEDYIQDEKLKLTLIILTKLTVIFFGTYSIFAVMLLTFGM